MIHYVIGDVTRPVGTGDKIVAHVCNNVGAWGAGVSGSIRERWPEVESLYKDFFLTMRRGGETQEYSQITHRGRELTISIGGMELGVTLIVRAAPDIQVANMIAQVGIGPGPTRIQYEPLKSCLKYVAQEASFRQASIHMPRIGCGLGGGKWERIEPILQETLEPFEVYVYDQTLTQAVRGSAIN